MKSYKDPSFEDRVGRAAEAKQKAIDRLRAKPPVDENLVAERQAARSRREAAEAEKRSARKASEEAARAAKAAEKSAIAEAAIAEAAARAAAVPAPLTDAEKKAARDARYAARKSRK
jgi:hypothetical protein